MKKQVQEPAPAPGAEDVPFTAASFVDVPKEESYADALAWAVDKGVTTGTDETHFSPDVPCTRAQIVTFLYRDMAK